MARDADCRAARAGEWIAVTSFLPAIISAVIALAGTGGVVFGALRYNRDEAGKVVTQQTTVLTSMQALNDELTDALTRAREDAVHFRTERDELVNELQGCRKEIKDLRVEVKRLHTLMERRGVHGTDGV